MTRLLFKNTLIIYLILILFLFHIFLVTPANGGTLNVLWDTESGQVMKPGETLNVPTAILNKNRYDVVVHLSILYNYSGVPEQDTYFCPCPNGTWSSKLNETDIILKGKEDRIIPLIIKSPKFAEYGEVYGLYFGMYVENYYFPQINDNNTYVFSAIIEYNVSNDDSNNNLNNNNHDIIKHADDIIQETNEDEKTIKNYYFEIAGLTLIITCIIAVFIMYKKS